MKSLKIPNDIDQTKYIEISFEQNSQQSESKLINAYTDGSRIEKDSTHQTGAGAIIFIDNQEIILKESLAPENTINQAELLAIHLVTKKLLEMETKESHLVIHTDSSTTLKRLTRSYSNSKQLTETIRSLHELQRDNGVEIVKVKAHANIEGNERADQIAKEATENSKDTQNTLGQTKSQITTKLKQQHKKRTLAELKTKNYSEFTKTTIGKIIKENTKLTIKNKETMRSLTLAISGQNNLRSALSHRDPSIKPNCELCGTKENSEHKLLHCPDLDQLRYNQEYRNIKENIYNEEEPLELRKFTNVVTKSGLFK